MHGDRGSLDVYAPQGPLLYRNFGPKGEAKETLLKLPKMVHYPAMMRHFRACIQEGKPPLAGGNEGLVLMQMIDAIYKSAHTVKSAEVRCTILTLPPRTARGF